MIKADDDTINTLGLPDYAAVQLKAQQLGVPVFSPAAIKHEHILA